MFRLFHRIFRFTLTKNHNQFHQSTQVSHMEKISLLNSVSQKLQLRLKPSILISDDSNIKKRFSQQEKMQLGLYIPKSPFNTRLSRRFEQQYLPYITNQLYQHQKQSLQTFVRIMQNNLFLQQSQVTLDHYINFIYKDIYARYLLSKNIGIEWQGFFANTGVLNSNSTFQYNHEAKFQQNYSILLDFIQNNAHLIHKDETIGLFSYYEKKFIHPSQIEIEKIKRLGYYIKEELNSFGKYENQFSILQEKNSKVYLLIMVEKLQKLINPNAICINPFDKFIMLKKFFTENDLNAEYLIISLETFQQHEKYFKDHKYEKHNTFDGKYLIGMQCMSVPIISEIQGYSRPPNAYVVNSHCHIGDFERVKAHDLPHFTSFINEFGEIHFKKSDVKIMLQSRKFDEQLKKSLRENKQIKESYAAVDEQLNFHVLGKGWSITKQLQKIFTKEGVHFMDFYDVLDDQLYFCEASKQVLHFRIGEKYSIQIPESNTQEILKGFEKQRTIISQSKIKIENLNPGKKPRERRRFRKDRKQKLHQVTDHQTLAESLSELTSISVSSLSHSQFVLPIFLKNSKVVPYQKILDEQQIELLLNGKIDQINYQKKKDKGYDSFKIYANEQLLKALIYLKNLQKNKDVRNVIIEPQAQTQELIPHAIHLNYLINKSKARGRKFNQQVKNNITLVKLHPTISETSKNISAKDLIEGITKSNQQKQYGLGLEALRLWTARHDSYLGDRTLSDLDINKQMQHSNFIRTTFWSLLSILPPQIKDVEPKLYLSKFILDSIDSFIINLEESYKSMDLHQAYLLINDFFQNILNQVYIKSIRERIIAFPNLTENEEHFFVIRRILELVAVISPLFPFSAYHISRKPTLHWPSVLNPKFYESIPLHNEMIQTRVKFINKLRLNKLEHAEIYIQSLKQTFSVRDLELFFNVKAVTFKKPDIQYRAFSLLLSKNNSITNDQRLTVYLSEDYCLRCDHKSKQTDHLCKTCVDYLQEQISQPFAYFPQSTHQKLT